MTFLNPSLLWGLLAISIPIIIHLFNFRRVKRVNFTNISLLKTVNTQAKSILKLKHWLILASRILFISSLIFAFAQPYTPSENGINGNGQAVISFYIDNSASMQDEVDNKSALNIALKKLESLSNGLTRSSKNQLITNDFTSTDYKSFNPTELKNESSKIEISGATRTIPEVFERQKSIVGKIGAYKKNNYFLFSDFQKSTIGDLTSIGNEKSNNVYLVPSVKSESHNVFIDSVWLDNPFIRKMQANGLNVKLSNSGDEPVKNMLVKMFLGDLQMNSIPTKIEANSFQTIHFDFTINQIGIQKGKISFDDNPVIFDNQYFFVLNASPKVNIVQINNSISPNLYLKNAFSNDSLFKYNSFPISNMDFGLLKNTDLLILEGIEYFNSIALDAIRNFLLNGGSVFLIPANNPDFSSYVALFGQFGIRNFEKNNNQNLELRPLSEPLKESLFYKDIFESTKIKDRLLMPTTSELMRWHTIGDAILKTKGSQNFLTYTVANKAKLFVLASPLEESYGNFPQNALFVPILYKIASLSVKSSPLAYRFDDDVIKLHDNLYSEKTLIKLRKDGVEMIPIQHIIGQELTIELPKTNEFESSNLAGYYDLLVNNNLRSTLAFNFSKSESLLETYSSKELKNLFAGNKNIQILDQENSVDFANAYISQAQGKYFWKYFVIAALVFLAFEILVIRFWR